MKKRIITLIVILCMLLLLGSTALAASQNANAAYYDVLQKKVNMYGYLPLYEGDTFPSGKYVMYARLVDFDHNGSDELFIVFYEDDYDISCEVWGYSGGSAFLITDTLAYLDLDDNILTGNALMINFTVGSYRGGYISLDQDTSGKYYIKYCWQGYAGTSDDYYFDQSYIYNIIQSGKWTYAKGDRNTTEVWRYDGQSWDYDASSLKPDINAAKALLAELKKSASSPAGNATATSSAVLVDGKAVQFEAITIGGSNYFKLRDIAYVLNETRAGFEVGWDASAGAITLTTGKTYTPNRSELTSKGLASASAVTGTSVLYKNGHRIAMTAYNIGGNNYFKLRDLAAVLDFNVGWDNSANTITIVSGESYAPPASYNGVGFDAYYLLLTGMTQTEVEARLGKGVYNDEFLCWVYNNGIRCGITDNVCVAVEGTVSQIVTNCPATLSFAKVKEIFGNAQIGFNEMDDAYAISINYGGFVLNLFGCDANGNVPKNTYFLLNLNNIYMG